MKLATALKAKGIIVPAAMVFPDSYDLDCPKKYCKENRASMGDDSLPLRIELLSKDYAEWKCRHCFWTDHVGDDPRVTKPAPEPVPQIPQSGASEAKTGLPVEILEYFEAINISPALVEANKIRWVPERNAIGFPYLDHSGEATNMMLVQLPEQTTRLASSKRISFYGINKVQPGAELVIVQGELEQIIFQACGIENTIGIPNSGNLPPRDYDDARDDYEYLTLAADLFKMAHRIVIATDNTPEGDRFRHEIARRMGAAKCFNVRFSKGTARRTYRELGIDALCADVREAVAQPIRGLYEVKDFQTQLLGYFNYGMAAGVSTGFENVDEFLTIAGSRLTVVTGIPNSGKSEFVDAITMNMSEKFGYKHGVFSPENGKEAHTVKLVEKRVMQSADPRNRRRMNEDTFLAGAEWVQQHYYFIFSDIMEEPPTLEWILARGSDAVLRYGIKTLIIDPWNRIQKHLGNKSETDYVAEALAQILRFAANHDVHVFLVAHPAKQEPDRKSGLFPVPSLYSIAGSAHFVNMCDNGVVVHRKPGADNITEIHIKKVRFKHEGATGVAKMVYNIDTGRYHPHEDGPTYSATFDTNYKPDFDNNRVKTYEAE